jgi:hypothetical protein
MEERKLNREAPLSFGHLPIGTSPIGTSPIGTSPKGEKEARSAGRRGSGHCLPDCIVQAGSQVTACPTARMTWSDEATGHWLATATPDGAASSVRVEALPGSLLPAAHDSKPEAQSSKLIIYNQRSSLSPLLRVYSHGRGRERLLKYNQCNTLHLPKNLKVCLKTTEGLSLLPRGNAGSGECPGAAAITTIISFLFSSPRGASAWELEFSHSDPFSGPTPAQKKCGVGNSASRRAVRLAHSLLVINQFQESCAVGMSPSGGQDPEYSGSGGQLPICNPLPMKKRHKSERRYVTNSNNVN